MMSTIDEETGITIAQKRSRNAANTTKERGSLAGANSPNANINCIYDNIGRLRMISFGKFREFCLKNNLSRVHFEKSLINNSVIEINKSYKKFIKYDGWSMRRLCRLRGFKWRSCKLL
jgi:hypothetical protein